MRTLAPLARVDGVVTSQSEPSPLTPPPAAALVLDFANTHAGGRTECFGDAAGLRTWLDGAGFADAGVTDADAASARELRHALQMLLLAHVGDEVATADTLAAAEGHLRRVAVRHPLVCVVRADGVSLEPSGAGLSGAFATLLAAVNELVRTDTWSRLKACSNPICHEAFFDRSRNSSAIYHAAQCASMVGMRAYRERKKRAQ